MSREESFGSGFQTPSILMTSRFLWTNGNNIVGKEMNARLKLDTDKRMESTSGCLLELVLSRMNRAIF